MISPVSAPQRGHSPSSARSGRSFSLSRFAISSTVAFVKSAIPVMKASRSPFPCSMSRSCFSQPPVSSGDVTALVSSIVTTWRPFGVGWSSLETRSTYSRRISVSMISARVAGVPSPRSFIASRNSSSSTSLPAVAFAFGVLVLPLRLRLVGLDPVDAAPAGFQRDLAAGAEALVLHLGDHSRARVPRRGMKDGEEAPGDQVENPTLVRREVAEIVRDVGRDDRVVVVDLGVIDD